MEIKDRNDVNILKAYYEDTEKYAFTFQIMALFTRFRCLIKSFDEAKKIFDETGFPVTILTERTILTDYYIFASMLNKTGKINKIEMDIYTCWFNVFSNEFPLYRSVYIKSSSEICLERVCSRLRDDESKISLEYLTTCHQQHEFFYESVLIHFDCKIFDGDSDINDESYDQKKRQIIDYLV